MISILTLPEPSWISAIEVLDIISVFLIELAHVETSFNTVTFSNASLISLYNSAFKGWVNSNPSIHLGNFIFICSTGNSYRTLENILLISSIVKSSQFVGITGVSYFSLRVLANSWV